MGVYQIDAKSILEPNLQGQVALCSGHVGIQRGCHNKSLVPVGTVQNTAHKRLPVGFETTPPRIPPLMHAKALSRGMPRSFSGAETRGRVVDGADLASACGRKRPVGCVGRPLESIPNNSYMQENTGLFFSYSIIMIPIPSPQGPATLPPRPAREGPVKAFRKDAVIVILPLVPR